MLSTLEGITFRHFRGEPDYRYLAEIETASNSANYVEAAISTEEVAHSFENPTGMDPALDVLMAEDQGVPVGFTKVYWRINAENERIYWQWGYVLPQWTRRGIGQALLNYTEGRARTHAAANPHDGPTYVRCIGEDTAHGKNVMFEKNAYPAIRYYCFMRRLDLNNLPAAALPAGLELRPAAPDQMRQIWDAREEGFRDHWGYAPKGEAEYQEWLHDPIHRPELWQIVWDTNTNEIAAVSLNEILDQDNEVFGFKRGWVSFLTVRRPYRKQGVATAMLASGMQTLRDHGMTEVVLGVDAENPSNALRLYESAGFKVMNKDAIYQKLLIY